MENHGLVYVTIPPLQALRKQMRADFPAGPRAENPPAAVTPRQTLPRQSPQPQQEFER